MGMDLIKKSVLKCQDGKKYSLSAIIHHYTSTSDPMGKLPELF